MIQICTCKEKEKEGDKRRRQVGGQWKVPSLVALGIFHVWLFLEGKEKTSFSPPSIFPPIRFYLNLSSIHLRFCFTMVLDHYFTSFFHFL
jgi:hypothetical protein